MALVLQPNGNGSPNDHHVMQGGWQVGRIYKRQDALRPETQWLWSISGISRGPDGLRLTGMSGTLDEALAALKDSWDKVMVWAQLTAAEREAGKVRIPRVLSVVISKSDPLACTPKPDPA
jgi:hypothetical protein